MRLFSLFIAVLIFLSSPIYGEDGFPLTNISVYDGDTIKATINFPLNISLVDQPIRLLGYDAPEISRVRRTVSIEDDELIRGVSAKNALSTILSSSKVYIKFGDRERDNYGRVLGELYIKSGDKLESVSTIMTFYGHIR